MKHSWKLRPIKIRTIKVENSFDTDRDGVKDPKDCQPFNPKRQDWNIEETEKRGLFVTYMHPDEYLKKASPVPPSFLQKYYDSEERREKDISHLSKIIADPSTKVDVPWVGEHHAEHEGRHRAYASKLAGITSIPVIRPSLINVSMRERRILGRIFIKEAGVDRDPSYASEWIRRFERGNPEAYMDLKNRKLYKKLYNMYIIEEDKI